jgi:hypothetical protein
MASTKDLYDELKGNPLVNVKDDYETFNAKLKDANFLNRLDEVMTKFGKDINNYDIPKKKKDGEVESSQPTEQPSATTEETQAVGVEPEGRPEEGEPGYNRELGPDQAFIDRGFTDYGTFWRNLKTGEIVYKPKKEANKKPDMPVSDLQEPPKAPEMPETPELMAPEKPIEEQVLETQAAQTPNTDVNNLDKTTVVGSVISEKEPDANKVNKIVDDANAVSGNTYKRKKKPTDSPNQAVIAYTPSSASDTVYVSQNGKVKSLDKRSSEYSEIISKNPYTVQLQNSEAFKDLLQLQKEGNKQGFQNYLETAGNPAAQEIADRAFGGFTNEPIIESTIISGDNKDREIPVQNTLLGKLKSTNLYQATESLWNNIINKNVDRPWQEEKEYDTEDFINNIDPSLSEEEKQSQQAFDVAFQAGTEKTVAKEPRKLSKPLYINTIDENLLYTQLEEKRKGPEFIKINPKTGAYEFPNAKDVNDFYEIEGNRVGRKMAESFMKEWDASPEQSEFRKNGYNQYKYQVYKDYKNWPINGSGSNLEFSLETIKNKEAEADFNDLNENGYKDAYSTQIKSPYDVQSEIDNIKKILDAQPNMPYAEKQKLYNQWGSLNDSLLFIYEQNIQDYATYLRNKGHEKEAADMLSTYNYYKRKTGGFQTMPVSELDDADKRVIMNLRNQAVNTTMRYLQSKYQTLSNTVDILTYQKLAQKPMQVVSSQFEILKSIGALDENGNINPSAKIKQSDQVKLSDAVLKINLAKDQVASAAESTGATPENLNELKRLGEKLGNLQSVEFSFYQNYAMNDLREEDENEKRNQKIAEDRMKSEDFFTSFFYTALYGGSNLFVSGLSTLAKLGKVPDNIADALGDETQLFDTWSAHVDELIKDMNGYQPQDMEGLSGMQQFWMNTTAGIGNLGAMALTGIVGGPLLTGLTMMSDMTDMAKSYGLDDDEAAQFGLLTSLVLGKITQIVPESKNFYDGLKPSIKNILKEYAKGRITYQEAVRMFNRTLLPSLEQHFKQIGGETAEEMLEEFVTQLMGMGANLTWDNASFNKNFDPNSIIGAGESAASLTAFLAPFKKGRKWNVLEQDALLSIVQNKETVLKNITFDSKEELDEITKQLTELENLETGLQSMPGYMELSNEKKSKVLTDLYIAKAMELAAKNRGLGKNDPGYIEAERMREEVLNSLKAPEKGEIPTQPELQKPEINAVQEPSTTEVLPSQQGEVRETGRKRQGMEPSIQGEEVAQESGKKKINSTEESQAYVDKLTEVKNNDPETYWSVSIPEVEDVENGTIIMNEDGQAVVGADGDIKAVYKNPDSEARRVSDTLLKEAIKAGGIKLDNFDIYLTKIYKENGFRIVSRLPFNEEYAPDGWNKAKHGTPDVVAMIYDPENKLNIEEKQFTNEQYDEAIAYRDTYVDAQREAYAKATESEVDTKAQEQRNSIANNLRKWKGDSGNMYSAGLGIPIAIWNGAIETIATALEAGVNLADAIQKAKDYLKRNYGKDYDEKQFAEDVMNISLDKVMEDKAKFVETTKEVANEVESGVIEGKDVDTWIKFSNKIVDKETKRKEKVEVFRGEVNQENVKENAQESYNSTALKLAQYNVFASEDFKNIVKDFSALPAKKQKQLISDYAGLIDKKIASIQKSIGKLDKKDENYKADKAEYENDIKALKEAKKNKSFEDVLNSLDQFSPNTKASIISDIFLNKEIVYNNKGEAIDYKKLNKDQQTQKAEAIYQKAKETVISNLTTVYNSVSPAIRNLSKLWYDGANLISQEFGKQYDLTLEQSAAIIATQSPQMPWFQNLHLAHAIMDIMKTQADTPFNQEMLDLYIKNTKGYKDQKAYIPEVKKLVGKKLSELSEYDASIFVRSYYELNMDKRSPIRIPSGTIVGYENKIASFSGYDTIAKGISIFRDGSQENISKRLGDANKVRNFYLNIANPNDDRAVTIDTHAMAIALMKPLGSSSYEVNFTPPYFAFYADAYREAAEKLGIKTRELQSITWEAARAIFPADEKTDSKKSEVSAVWDKYNNGEITLEQAQNQILQDGKDPNITEWAEFTGQLLDSEQRAAIFLPIRPSERAKTATTVGDGTGTGSDVPGVGGGNNGKRTSTKIAKGLRKGAEVARKGKTGGLAVNPIDPFLEVIAKALEAGASLTEAIAKGIEAFKNSDFYKNLTAQEKSKAVNDLKRAMDEQIAPTIANLINEEMLKGKGVYTASQNVKNQMIKEGVIDEATFDRIVGKAEKIVKAQAEEMIVNATDKAVEDIRSGAGLDNALNSLSDFINNEVGFFKSQDKTLKKDLVEKAKVNVMDQLATKIAGDAKSYMDVENMSKADAIEKALGDATSQGMEFSTVDQLRDSVKNSVDKIKSKDSAEARKNEPVVTTTDKEIMKDKLKAMDAALKEAVAKAKQDKKDDKEMRQLVRNWVKEYLKTSGISAKISPTQLKAIVSRATGVVADMTDTKMKALTDYVEKVVADQEYAQMINDLEKNKKGASKKRHNQYTEAVRRYLSLPLVNSDGTPLMNDQELKAYAESVARLNQSVPDHSRMDMNLATRVLNDYNEIPSKLEKSDFDDAVTDIKNSTISDLAEYNEFVKKVNKAKRILDSLYNNGKVTEDEYSDALNDLYTKENGLRVYEQQHQDQINDLKENMIDDIVDMSNYVDKSGFIGQQAEVYKRLEIMLTKPEMLMSLDVKDIVKLTEVMDRMADGFVAEKELREIVNKAETRGQKKGESIVKQLSTIYKSLNSPDLTKLRNLLKLTEAAQVERVLGLSSGPIYNNIIQPINSAFTKMRKNTERLMDDYYKARQENKFKGDVVVKRSEYDTGLGSKISDKITVKADKYYSTRVAMLSSIFDYASKAMEQKADTKDFWGENLEKDDVKKAYHNDGSLHIVNDIYSKLNNDPRFQTNGKLDYTKVYEAFLNDPKSVMSEAEYKLYEATQKINKKEIGEALVSANAIRGINGEISAVHYPRKSLGKSSTEDADLVAGTGGKVGGLRAGSSYARVLETPKDAIDLNLDRVMATQIYEASRDLYLNDAIQQTNEVFRNAKENANPDEKALLQAIQDWNRKRVDFELEKSAKNVITRAFGGFASYALIGKVRTTAEFTTNLLAGIFNQLSNVAKIGPKALTSPVNPIQAREAMKLMEKFDSPVQFMGWSMKSYAKYGNGKVDKDNLSSFYNNAVNMLMNISGPLTAGEWKADFDAKFKELTGEKYNEAKHLENDEYFYAMQQASSYANQQIERIKGGAFKGQGKQFVAANPITDIKKLFPGVKIKDEEGMLSANDTFAQMTNMFNNFVSRDVKNFVSGAKQAGSGRDITGGFKDMLGSTYRLGSYYLIYNLIDAAMKSALGDDEEKKKGEKKMEMFTTEEGRWDTAFNTALNLVTTVATSKYGANGKAIAIATLNALYNSTQNEEQKQMAANALNSMYFQEPVEVRKYGAAEKFVYIATTSYIPPADVISDQLQREFDRLSGSDKYKGATITDFFDQTGKFFNDPEVVEYRKFMAGSLTLATQIALVSGKNIPFLKDIVKFVKKDIQDKQNIVILNKNGENMVEGVLDFDIDGNGMISVTVDVPGMPADQKKVLNETLSNSASDKFNKLIEKNKERIDRMPENNVEQEAEKFAQIQYYYDLAVHQAKVEAKLAKPEEAPKEPSMSSDYFESQEQKKKWVEAYQTARATGKFSSASKLSTSKDVQEGVQKLIDSSPYKDSYNALDPKKVENGGAIKAMYTYFNDLYKYNVTPVPGKEPKASDYFYKDYNGKITPVE